MSSGENWEEIRTAYQVARRGTVSGAAEALGVHHATVIRHIDALEARMGAKLFQRHARGYTPTDAGRELMSVAQAADDQFSQLSARIGGARDIVEGELIVTSIPGLTRLVTPALIGLMANHPDLSIRYLTDQRIYRLQYGEAHVAIRAGARPEEPDNVVQMMIEAPWALYASRSYLENAPPFRSVEDLNRHRFAGPEDMYSRAPFWRWLTEKVEPGRFVFRSNDWMAHANVIRAGQAIGFMAVADGGDLVQLLPPIPEWAVHLWLVTHVDLHRLAKVQALLTALKEAGRTAQLAGGVPELADLG